MSFEEYETRISELEDALLEKDDQIRLLNDELDQVQSGQAETQLQEELEELEAENDELSTRAAKLQEQVDQLTQEREGHEDERIKANEKISRTESRLSELETQLEHSEAEVKRLQRQRDNDKRELARLRARFQSQHKLSDSSTSELLRTANEADHMRDELQQLKAEVRIQRDAFREAEEEKKEALQHNEELGEAADVMRAEIVQLDESLRKAQDETAVARQALENANREWESERASFQDQIDELKLSLSEERKKVAEEQDRNQSLQKEMERIKNETQIASLESDLDQLREELATIKNERDELIQETSGAEQQIRALSDQVDQLEELQEKAFDMGREEEKKRMQAEMSRMSSLQEELNRERERYYELEEQLRETQARLENTEYRNQQYEQGYGMGELVQELDTLREENARLEKDLTITGEELRDRIDTIYTLTEIARRLAQETGKYPDDVDVFKIYDSSDLMAKHASLIEQYKMDNEMLERQVDELQEERVRLMKELRINARQMGEDGLFYFGLTGEQMRLVNEFAENLRQGRIDLPEKDSSRQYRNELEQLRRQLVDERAKFAEASLSFAQERKEWINQSDQKKASNLSQTQSSEDSLVHAKTNIPMTSEQYRLLEETLSNLRQENQRLHNDLKSISTRQSKDIRDFMNETMKKAMQQVSRQDYQGSSQASMQDQLTSEATEIDLQTQADHQESLEQRKMFEYINRTNTPQLERLYNLLEKAEREKGRLRREDIPTIRQILDMITEAQNKAADQGKKLQSRSFNVSARLAQSMARVRELQAIHEQTLQTQGKLEGRIQELTQHTNKPQLHPATPLPNTMQRARRNSAFTLEQQPDLTQVQPGAGLLSPGARQLLQKLQDNSTLPSGEVADEVNQLTASLLQALEQLLLRQTESEELTQVATLYQSTIQRIAAQVTLLYRSFTTNRRAWEEKLQKMEERETKAMEMSKNLKTKAEMMDALEKAENGMLEPSQSDTELDVFTDEDPQTTRKRALAMRRLNKKLTYRVATLEVSQPALERRVRLLETEAREARTARRIAEAAVIEVNTTLQHRILYLELWKRGAETRLHRMGEICRTWIPETDYIRVFEELTRLRNAHTTLLAEEAAIRDNWNKARQRLLVTNDLENRNATLATEVEKQRALTESAKEEVYDLRQKLMEMNSASTTQNRSNLDNTTTSTHHDTGKLLAEIARIKGEAGAQAVTAGAATKQAQVLDERCHELQQELAQAYEIISRMENNVVIARQEKQAAEDKMIQLKQKYQDGFTSEQVTTFKNEMNQMKHEIKRLETECHRFQRLADIASDQAVATETLLKRRREEEQEIESALHRLGQQSTTHGTDDTTIIAKLQTELWQVKTSYSAFIRRFKQSNSALGHARMAVAALEAALDHNQSERYELIESTRIKQISLLHQIEELRGQQMVSVNQNSSTTRKNKLETSVKLGDTTNKSETRMNTDATNKSDTGLNSDTTNKSQAGVVQPNTTNNVVSSSGLTLETAQSLNEAVKRLTKEAESCRRMTEEYANSVKTAQLESETAKMDNKLLLTTIRDILAAIEGISPEKTGIRAPSNSLNENRDIARDVTERIMNRIGTNQTNANKNKETNMDATTSKKNHPSMTNDPISSDTRSIVKRIVSLHEQLRTAELAQLRHRRELNDAQDEIRTLNSKRRQDESHIRTLEEEVVSLRSEVSRREDEYQRQLQQFDMTQKKLSPIQASNPSSEQPFHKHEPNDWLGYPSKELHTSDSVNQARLRVIEAKLEESEKYNNERRAELMKMKGRLQEAQKVARRRKRVIAFLARRLTSFGLDIHAIKSQIKQFDTDLDNSQSKLETSVEETERKDDIHDGGVTYESKIEARYKREIDQLQQAARKTIEHLRELLNRKDRTLQTYQDKMKWLQEEIEAERKRANAQRAQMSDSAYNENQAAIRRLRDAVAELQHQGEVGTWKHASANVESDLLARTDILEQQLIQKDHMIDSLKSQLDNCTQQNKTYAKDLAKANNETDALRKQVADNTTVASLRRELTSKDKKLKALQASLIALKEEFERKQTQELQKGHTPAPSDATTMPKNLQATTHKNVPDTQTNVADLTRRLATIKAQLRKTQQHETELDEQVAICTRDAEEAKEAAKEHEIAAQRAWQEVKRLRDTLQTQMKQASRERVRWQQTLAELVAEGILIPSKTQQMKQPKKTCDTTRAGMPSQTGKNMGTGETTRAMTPSQSEEKPFHVDETTAKEIQEIDAYTVAPIAKQMRQEIAELRKQTQVLEAQNAALRSARQTVEITKNQLDPQQTIAPVPNAHRPVPPELPQSSESTARIKWETEKKYKRRIEQLSQQLATKAKTASEAEQAIQRLQTTIQRLQSEKDELVHKNKSLNKRLKEFDTAKQTVLRDMEPIMSLRSQLQRAEDQLSELRIQTQSELEAEVRRLKKEAEIERKKMEQAQMEAHETRNQLDRILRLINGQFHTQTDPEHIETFLNQSQSILSNLNQETKLSLEEGLASSEANIRAKCIQLQQRIGALESLLLTRDASILQFRFDLQEYQQRCNRLSDYVQELETFLTFATNQDDTSTTNFTTKHLHKNIRKPNESDTTKSTTIQVEQYKETITALKRVVEKQQRQLERNRTDETQSMGLVQAKQRIKKLQAELASVQTELELEKKRKIPTSAPGIVPASATKLKELERELTHTQRIVVSREEALRSTKELNKKLESRIHELETILSTRSSSDTRLSSSKLETLQQNLTVLEKENKDLRTELSAFDAEFFEEIEDLKYQYSQALAKCEAFDQLLADLGRPPYQTNKE